MFREPRQDHSDTQIGVNRKTSEEVLGVASRGYEDTHSKDN